MNVAVKAENPRAVSGSNFPPLETYLKEINDGLPDRLRQELDDELKRTRELAENAAGVPSSIDTDEEEKKASDILSQMAKHVRVVESRREGIKAPILQAGKIIDNICKVEGQQPLESEHNRINPGLTKFKREKVEAERRRLEEVQRLAREEADRQRRDAEEADRKRREAEQAKLKAEQARRDAEEATRKAEQDRKDAEARRIKAEADARAAEERARVARDEETRRAAEAAAAKARDDAERAEKERKWAEDDAARERENAKAAKTGVALARADLSDANKEAKTAGSLAKQAESDAHKSDKAANAKASTLSSARGEYGGHSGLKTVWVGDIVDRDVLVAQPAIWAFIAEEDLQKALNAFVRANKGSVDLAGARIYEDNKTVVR